MQQDVIGADHSHKRIGGRTVAKKHARDKREGSATSVDNKLRPIAR